MTLTDNERIIETEIAWFERLLDLRLAAHAKGEDGADIARLYPPPALPPGPAPYAELVRTAGLGAPERLVLMLALMPHLKPSGLDVLLVQNTVSQRRFTEFGGLVAANHPGFLPSRETALFLLAGEAIALRLRHLALFAPDHVFQQRRFFVAPSAPTAMDEPSGWGALTINPDIVARAITGKPRPRSFSAEFPAQRLTTALTWDELVLDAMARRELDDIIAWHRHESLLMEGWQLARRIKPGYRCLFHGPPGTGKTLTASLLGNETGLPVYRIDLSKVISKYIGETEKNLASLFDHAWDGGLILFFDEADALFGKRTEARTANDRAANQQIAYLLQRIEDYPGIVILASNLRAHLDDAFSRRFQSVIAFLMPDAEQRLRLWRDSFADKPFPLASDVDLARLARDYEIAGGSIINVLRHACLKAVRRDPPEIRQEDLLGGIKRELQKDGKVMM